jgi:hypothetical protein
VGDGVPGQIIAPAYTDPIEFKTLIIRIQLRIPTKENADSEGNANGILRIPAKPITIPG